VTVEDGETQRTLVLSGLPLDPYGYVVTAEATFDPPTSPLDENVRVCPMQCSASARTWRRIEVDTELGTVRVLKITAAHDVGRAINPT